MKEKKKKKKKESLSVLYRPTFLFLRRNPSRPAPETGLGVNHLFSYSYPILHYFIFKGKKCKKKKKKVCFYSIQPTCLRYVMD